MVLRVFLTDDLSHPRPLWTWMAGIAVPDAQELARASANAPTLALIQGSASTPAQGGKGDGKGGGRGGKGGDRGGATGGKGGRGDKGGGKDGGQDRGGKGRKGGGSTGP